MHTAALLFWVSPVQPPVEGRGPSAGSQSCAPGPEAQTGGVGRHVMNFIVSYNLIKGTFQREHSLTWLFEDSFIPQIARDLYVPKVQM